MPEFARYATRKRQLLFDQKYSQALFPVQLQDNIANFVDDVWLDSFGGLIENQQLRLEDQGSANRELLLLPDGKVAASAFQDLSTRQVWAIRRAVVIGISKNPIDVEIL